MKPIILFRNSVSTCLLFVWSVTVTAQGLTRSDADVAFQSQQYEIAAENYRKVVANNPKDGRSLYRLGFSLLTLKKYDEAITFLAAGAKVKFVPQICYYNIACAYANKGEVEKALDFLEKSTRAGYLLIDDILRDADMATLLENERFKQIISDARKPTSNSPYAFLIDSLQGQWEVASTSDGGLMTWTASLTGFSQSVDIVVGRRRVLYFLLSYWGKAKNWIVNGADAWGGTYSGPISISKNTIFIADEAGGAKLRKIEITLVKQDVINIKFVQNTNGTWIVRREYRLEPKAR